MAETDAIIDENVEKTPMEQFKAEIKALLIEYDSDLGVSSIVIGLAIEAFIDLRNYPSSYDEDKILADMKANINKIAMAAIEIDAKNGVENQLGHSDNGISRTYSKELLAYSGVIGFAKIS